MEKKKKIQRELTYKERHILYVLASFGIGRILDIGILSGFNNYTYVSRKLSELQKMGYISSEYMNRHLCYFLTAKGYAEIGKRRVAYDTNSTSLHDMEVTRIATYLYLKEGVSYADFLTDRQQKYLLSGSRIHRSDLVLGKVAYEYERSPKDNARLKNNLKANKKFDKQVWIVPENRQFIAERIRKFEKELLIQNVEVMMLSEINEYVLNADISNNKLRDKPVLGERNYELVKRGTNNIMDKYNAGGRKDV